MPFTVSHIAAILPAHQPLRRWGLFSAAMIGAMVPDFGFLFPAHLARTQTHSALALLKFCLPMGLACWLVFQALIKPAWAAVLPDGWRMRLLAEHPGVRLANWRLWPYVALAILAGALTHLVWDGFTHEDGRGVRMLPFLEDTGPELAGHALPLYRWLQHGSSLLGLIAVLWAVRVWTRRAASMNAGAAGAGTAGDANTGAVITLLSRRERMAWLAAYILPPLCVLGAAAAWYVVRHVEPFNLGREVTRLAYLVMGSSCATLLGVSVLVTVRLATLAKPRLDA